MKRKIKIDNIVHDFDRSDGLGDILFGMNGVGGTRIFIDGVEQCTNGFIYGTNKMLDGSINFTRKIEIINCDFYHVWVINDKRYDELLEIHKLKNEEIDKIPHEDRLRILFFGLEYEGIRHIGEGYRFGKELTYDNFCITFDKNQIVVFKSSHNSYIAPDFLKITSGNLWYDAVLAKIKLTINEYFGF